MNLICLYEEAWVYINDSHRKFLHLGLFFCQYKYWVFSQVIHKNLFHLLVLFLFLHNWGCSNHSSSGNCQLITVKDFVHPTELQLCSTKSGWCSKSSPLYSELRLNAGTQSWTWIWLVLGFCLIKMLNKYFDHLILVLLMTNLLVKKNVFIMVNKYM